LDEHARRIWQKTFAIGEDDLISFVLQGTGDRIEHCPLVKSLAILSDKELARRGSGLQYDDATLSKMLLLLSYPNFCVGHGFKPFVYYRPLYEMQHRRLGIMETIEKRDQPNGKDLFMLGEYDPSAGTQDCRRAC
jgi:hypothetical protein